MAARACGDKFLGCISPKNSSPLSHDDQNGHSLATIRGSFLGRANKENVVGMSTGSVGRMSGGSVPRPCLRVQMGAKHLSLGPQLASWTQNSNQ